MELSPKLHAKHVLRAALVALSPADEKEEEKKERKIKTDRPQKIYHMSCTRQVVGPKQLHQAKENFGQIKTNNQTKRSRDTPPSKLQQREADRVTDTARKRQKESFLREKRAEDRHGRTDRQGGAEDRHRQADRQTDRDRQRQTDRDRERL